MLSELDRNQASLRRMRDMHITAYPSVLNSTHTHCSIVSSAASELGCWNRGPLCKSVNCEARRRRDESMVTSSPTLPSMMTMNQFNARMSEIGRGIHREYARRLEEGKPMLDTPAVKYDARSTYRLDYTTCPSSSSSSKVLFDGAARRTPHTHASPASAQKTGKRGSCTDEQQRQVNDSMRYPYRTVPHTEPASQATVYRHDYMAGATPEQLRSVSCKTDPAVLRPSYAYSVAKINVS